MDDHCDSDVPLDINSSGCEENMSPHSPEECRQECEENVISNSPEEYRQECEEKLTPYSPEECKPQIHHSNENANDVFHTPRAGMIFGSEDEVRSYYTNYANQEGFRFMTRSSKKGHDGKVKYLILACSREGTRRADKENAIRNTQSRKQKCEAKINVSLCKDGTYRIKTVTLSHNHELLPRQVTQVFKDTGIRVKEDIDMRVKKTSDQTEGGNYHEKERQMIGKDGDAGALQKYLVRMQEKDSNFFYAIDLDDFFCLRNVFWADGRSRAAYQLFGDVVMVDTTYLLNRYKVPLATFVGVNHHGQSILFGCGLLSGEDMESFVWLFQSWLNCMSGVVPQGIITDHTQAMQNAIETVFPSTRHRWCLSYILKKLPQKLHGYAKYKSIRDHLQDVIYDTLTTNDFERNWKKIVENFGLEDNKWLEELFIERHRWVPTFVRGDFWAGMSISQRNESLRAFFDGYVNHQTTLKQFVDQYDSALQDKVEKEFVADVHSSCSTQSCASNSLIERQFQSTYTHAKFIEVKNEFVGKADCNVFVAHDDGSVCHYNVIEDVVIGDKSEEAAVKVTFDRVNCNVKCTCHLFEFKGILCRHSLAILSQERIKEVPSKYIFNRWRKNIKRKYVYIKTSYGVQHHLPEMQRLDLLCNDFVSVASVAAEFEETTSFVKVTLHSLKEKLEAWTSHLRNSSQVEVAVPSSQEPENISAIFGVGDAII